MNLGRLWTTLAIQGKASPYKTGLLGVLAVTLLVLVGRQIWRGPRTVAAAPSFYSSATGVASVLGSTPAMALLPRPPLPDLPDSLARDLFRDDWLTQGRVSRLETAVREDENQNPSDGAPVLLLELTLTERTGDGQRYAVINGRRVQVGDTIGELVVESITPGLVILIGSKSRRTALRMD